MNKINECAAAINSMAGIIENCGYKENKRKMHDGSMSAMFENIRYKLAITIEVKDNENRLREIQSGSW